MLNSEKGSLEQCQGIQRGIILWQAACIALLWVVWRERNARIFEDKSRNSENL